MTVNTVHIFGTCEKIQVLWDVASETVKSLCNINVDFRYLRNNLKMDFVDVNIGKNEDIVKVLIYLNSVINFSIWKTRNEIKFEFSL